MSSRRETSRPGAPARGCELSGWSGVFSASCAGAFLGCPGPRIAAPARRAGRKRCVIMRLYASGRTILPPRIDAGAINVPGRGPRARALSWAVIRSGDCGAPKDCACARAKPPSPAPRHACSAWSQRYNEEHPHSALGWLSPNQYAYQWAQHHQ